jgi:alkylated DNA repair dioxygenase AlkB
MIKGLTILKNIIPEDCGNKKEPCQKCYIHVLDTYNWRIDLKRRTQHYGARYDYITRKLVYDVQPFPPLIQNFADYISDIIKPNQCIVNEYTVGQLIGPHIDSKLFGPIVVTISLGSTMIMKMSKGEESHLFTLEGGDMVILKEEARYEWKHELLPNKESRRISLTFRTIN